MILVKVEYVKLKGKHKDDIGYIQGSSIIVNHFPKCAKCTPVGNHLTPSKRVDQPF